MIVAIIGAGAAGLAASRHAIAEGLDCVVFEANSQLGGTWIYTDEVGTDKYGFPVFSSMYRGLRTNLPKEVMGFPDFPIPEQKKSYLSQSEILNFLDLYAENFELKKYIRFNTLVQEVRPAEEEEKWLVKSINKYTKVETVEMFDAVMVCNGHYNEPSFPEIPGQDKFRGRQCHSHEYRHPEPFTDQNVLVIGSGPSGLDMALHVSKVAKTVVLSHHSKQPITTPYPENVSQKPDVRCIRNDEVEFMDGTCCKLDIIFYCTGYKYSFPFLHESCGITVDDNYIQPLYKHMVHIQHPTMCFIGIPFNVCAFQMFDLQARYYVKGLTGSMRMPTKEEMKEDTHKDMESRWDKGYTKRQAHMMGDDQKLYYDELAKDANITTIAPVIVNLRQESVKRLFDDLLNFREDVYKIVDDETFIKVY